MKKKCCHVRMLCPNKSCSKDNLDQVIDMQQYNPLIPQAAQTHVAREGCNVIYITYVTRAGVALAATVENIRDFVWEICH